MDSNYKKGFDRNQIFFGSLDDFISQDNDARVIDAFVDTLDMSDFKYSSTSSKGNRPYNPRTLLKIYILGYLRQTRSSRKLENALATNVEFMWIANGLRVKHTTIADFRKVNHKLLKNVMINFNLNLKSFNLISNTDSTDGTKVKAVNSKDKNFTLNKLDERIARAKKSVEEYEKQFDAEESNDQLKELLQDKIIEYNQKIQNFKKIQKTLIDNNSSQLSLTDPESKLMRNNGKFEVSYNNQVCVDIKSHIVKTFQLTTNPADLGTLNNISSEVKNIYNQDIEINTTDKGYYDSKDMINCLENGIIPEVTPPKGKDSFILETDYEENIITDDTINSTKNGDIKKCLRSATIPNVYKDKITDIKIETKNKYIDDENEILDDESSSEEKRALAISNNCFVRDFNENLVYCPMGEILRKKSYNNGRIRFCNKLACKNCKNPCCSSKFKVVDFSTNQKVSGKNIKKRKVRRKKRKLKK